MAAGDLPEARVIPSLKQAWTNIWPNFWWLLLFALIVSIVNGVQGSQTGTYTATDAVLDGVGGLLTIFVGIPLSFGLTKAHLAASRGEKPTWGHFGHYFKHRYFESIGLGLLVALLVVVGFALLVIPGIFLLVKVAFSGQHFIEHETGIVDSIKASFEDTKGRWWSVFGLILITIPLIIAGALALVVGIFVAIVLIQQMFVVYWRALHA
ncbi:MAG: hypothetical protein ACPHID_00720 [Thermoplasmatota archaeon]